MFLVSNFATVFISRYVCGELETLRGPALSKAELVSKLQACEQARQVLEGTFNGMVQEVLEIKCIVSGILVSDSSHGSQLEVS